MPDLAGAKPEDIPEEAEKTVATHAGLDCDHSISHDLSKSVLNEFRAIQSELKQINHLLQDAISMLTKDFQVLEKESRRQSDLIRTLLEVPSEPNEETYATINFEEFINKTESLLNLFVESILHNSKHSMQLVEDLEDIAKAIREILDDAKKVNALADRTKILGLNASIEAARAGAGGEGFNVVAAEVKKLGDSSKGFSQQISKHVIEITEALNNAEESTNTIASKDMSFTLHAKHDTNDMMNRIHGLNQRMIESMDMIGKINDNIKSRVDHSITVLQFEDLTSQLIGKIETRINAMEKIFSEDGTLYYGENQSDQVDAIVSEETLPSVKQENMEAGSIELF